MMQQSGAMMLEVPAVADAAALSACAQRIFCDTFAHMNYPPADLATFLEWAMGVDAYARLIADPAYALRIVRGADGAIVGFVKGGPNDLPLPDGDPLPAQTWELHQLYLDRSAQGSGIADAMMTFVEQEARARGTVALYLSVWVDNERAKRFYARHGFVEVGKNPFHVGSVVDDDRVWRKWL